MRALLDYHVHLWPHAERAERGEYALDRLERYCAAATVAGVEELAVTEHLFRFAAGRAAVGEFWEQETDGELRSRMRAYFDHHATADLDEYVEAGLAAKAAGLPIVLGLEVDYYPGKMDAVASLLAGYPFDVLLGSVHWLGTWMFDDIGDAIAEREWHARGAEYAWRAYTDALEELAATGACDVLAHPDLVKVTGRRPSPGVLDECHDRMAEIAAASGMAAEISSAGWRKPVGEAYPAPELLARFHARAVSVTTASDSHGPGHVASRAAELATLARAAGYAHLRAFRARVGRDVELLAPVAP
jgi:histidinol-phosphatase (PHP family)